MLLGYLGVLGGTFGCLGTHYPVPVLIDLIEYRSYCRKPLFSRSLQPKGLRDPSPWSVGKRAAHGCLSSERQVSEGVRIIRGLLARLEAGLRKHSPVVRVTMEPASATPPSAIRSEAEREKCILPLPDPRVQYGTVQYRRASAVPCLACWRISRVLQQHIPQSPVSKTSSLNGVGLRRTYFIIIQLIARCM